MSGMSININDVRSGKKIFIYWAQGFDNAPMIVKKCLKTWKKHNPDYEIIELDDDNLIEWIDINQYVKNKCITKTSLSDLIRICLLKKHGGIWCDATTYCMKPLSEWINDYIQSGFFAYEMTNDRLLSSWFLYGEPDNYIVNKWFEETIKYIENMQMIGLPEYKVTLNLWKKQKYVQHYFWFHYLFGDLYKNDKVFKKAWDVNKKIDAEECFYLMGKLTSKMDKKIEEHMKNSGVNMYKVTYKYGVCEKNSVVDFLLRI